MADLKPYPAMKDSGVPSLGYVPEPWKVQRLRNLVDMRVATAPAMKSGASMVTRVMSMLTPNFSRVCRSGRPSLTGKPLKSHSLGQRASAKVVTGSVDSKDCQTKIIRIMEGGPEAFERRKTIYQIWKAQPGTGSGSSVA